MNRTLAAYLQGLLIGLAVGVGSTRYLPMWVGGVALFGALVVEWLYRGTT